MRSEKVKEISEKWLRTQRIFNFHFSIFIFFVSLHLIPIGRKSTRGATSDCG